MESISASQLYGETLPLDQSSLMPTLEQTDRIASTIDSIATRSRYGLMVAEEILQFLHTKGKVILQAIPPLKSISTQYATIGGSLGVSIGSLLCFGTLARLASNFTALCTYRGRLHHLKASIEEKKRVLDKAMTPVASETPTAYQERMNSIIHLQRGLKKKEQDLKTLKQSLFPMAYSFIDLIDIGSGALGIAKSSLMIAGATGSHAFQALSVAIPALSIAAGSIWSIVGSILTIKTIVHTVHVHKELRKTEIKLSAYDENYKNRFQALEKQLDLSTLDPDTLKDLFKEEQLHYKQSGLKLPRLTIQQYQEYQALQRAQNSAVAQANPLLFKKCLHLNKSLLSKKQQILSLERRKQICKIVYYSLLTIGGILGVAAGAAAIALSAGAATPVVLGLTIPIIFVGGGMVSTDWIARRLEKSQKKVELFYSLEKGEGLVEKPEDLPILAEEIMKACPEEDKRKDFLSDLGFTQEEIQECAQSTETLVLGLLNHFSPLFPQKEGEKLLRILKKEGITNYKTKEELASRILTHTNKSQLLKQLGIKRHQARSPDSLASILGKRFPDIFPKKKAPKKRFKRIRNLLF